ncbi:MAG: NAD-dependent epimerase/dehydratase family protein [Lachnospiraceae bacterium]|nr:NAD-dependent epimerase/dehydratase family protein [Lachnospiraceae bacterium]
MSEKLLVIGGTYFLGKAFVSLMLRETDCEITIMHRGTSKPSGGSEGDAKADAFEDYKKSGRLKEILADRHDGSAIREIREERFDAVIDFCAYIKEDISFLLDRLSATIGRYIFISTVDVYERGLGRFLNEDAQFETRTIGGAAGDYIAGKVALEGEIRSACERKGCTYTVLRPAIIFGPDNYAPREGMYFHWILNAGQILHPVDADGEFQLVYVEDVAKAIKLVLENEKAANSAYNVCENKMITYESFAKCLAEISGTEFTRLDITLDVVNEKGLPLPFPLTKAESNYYDGSRLAELGMEYTDMNSAMKHTYLEYVRRNK